MKCLGIIPARYASTRFPGKPLVDIAGKSMIQRVYERASMADSISQVVVATDDQRIFDHVTQFGGAVVMTAESHPSGTDRCNEAAQQTQGNFDVVVNIQGDEPYIHPEQLDQLVGLFAEADTQLATLCKRIDVATDLTNPNKVKVVRAADGHALYFSRQALPNVQGTDPSLWMQQHEFYRHIGLYGYRTEVLQQITRLPPSQLEKAESLEQLRWLENGYRIKVGITELESPNVDTPQDLEAILKR